ncbi:MAG: hypothetical protein ACYSRP_05130 [Planctomycetota bacterium]
MKKLLSIAIGGGVGGPVLIIILILIVYPNLFVHGLIMHEIEEEFGGRATAEDVSFTWKRGVQISRLLVHDKEGERPILTVDSVQLKFKILPLLMNQLIIERLDINRPELVQYTQGKEGYRPLGLGLGAVAGASLGGSQERTLPKILQMRINGGTFLFTDVSTDRSTNLENLNLRISGTEPGGAALINGECDIIGGGGQDHAVISGTIEGYERPSLESVRADLAFTSGFADIKVILDMSNLDEPGQEVAKVSVKADLQEAIARLGGILALPDDVKIRGTLDSEVAAIAQPEESFLLIGAASSASLYVQSAGLFDEPIQVAQAVSSYKVLINPTAGLAKIETFALDIDGVNTKVSGDVRADGTLSISAHVSAPIEALAPILVDKSRHSDDSVIAGEVISDTEIQGSLRDTITVNGTSRVTGLDLEYETFKYSDPDVTLEYEMDYNNLEETAHIKKAALVADIFNSNLKNVLITLGGRGHYQGELSADFNAGEIYSLDPLFPFLALKGKGQANLEFQGTLEGPLYKSLNASGSMAMGKVVYENSNLSIQAANIVTEKLSVMDGHFTCNTTLLVNGAPAEALFDMDLALDIDGGPYIGGGFHMTNVPLTYTMKGGDLSGLVTFDVDKTRVEGIKWDETFQKTLTAKGQVKVVEGLVSATEILSSVFMGLAKPGVAERIELIESDFEIRDEKMYTEQFHIAGSPFDLRLSGWIGFDEQLEYDAVVLLSGKTHKGIQKVFRAAFKDSPLPLKITGSLSDPTIQFTGSASLMSVLVAEKVLQGTEGIVRTGLEVPTAVLEAPIDILKGVDSVLGGGKGSEEGPKQAPEDAAGDSKAQDKKPMAPRGVE